jgi:hypothetical protein
VRFDQCRTHPVQLWDAGPERRSACLRVLPEFADGPVAGTARAPQPADTVDVTKAR